MMKLFGKKKSGAPCLKDVAIGYERGFVLKPLDVFTCGMGLYAAMQRKEEAGAGELVILEIIDLNDTKLGEGLEDYCFIATPDVMAEMKARKRQKEGQCNPEGLTAMNLRDARTMDEIENVLGRAVLEHPKAKNALFLHKKIEI